MIISVQWLRGVAAFLVLWSHAVHKVGQLSGIDTDFLRIGGGGVDLFFIISGFIMCYVTDRRNIDFIPFMLARIKRIIPLYYILTLLALVVFLVAPRLVNSSGGDTSILHSFTLWPIEGKYLINNGWTLSYEFFFYFIFALSLLIPSGKLLFVSFFLIVLVCLGLMVPFDGVAFQFFTDAILLEFVLGIISFFIYQKYKSELLGFLSLVLGLILFFMTWLYGVDVHRVLTKGVPMAFIFIGFIMFEDRINNAQGVVANLLSKIGDSSYSLYLAHVFSLAGTAFLIRLLGFQSYVYLNLFVLITVSLFVGYACYIALEKPIATYFSGVRKL